MEALTFGMDLSSTASMSAMCSRLSCVWKRASPVYLVEACTI
jgi:hypothetical protein